MVSLSVFVEVNIETLLGGGLAESWISKNVRYFNNNKPLLSVKLDQKKKFGFKITVNYRMNKYDWLIEFEIVYRSTLIMLLSKKLTSYIMSIIARYIQIIICFSFISTFKLQYYNYGLYFIFLNFNNNMN